MFRAGLRQVAQIVQDHLMNGNTISMPLGCRSRWPSEQGSVTLLSAGVSMCRLVPDHMQAPVVV